MRRSLLLRYLRFLKASSRPICRKIQDCESMQGFSTEFVQSIEKKHCSEIYSNTTHAMYYSIQCAPPMWIEQSYLTACEIIREVIALKHTSTASLLKQITSSAATLYDYAVCTEITIFCECFSSKWQSIFSRKIPRLRYIYRAVCHSPSLMSR